MLQVPGAKSKKHGIQCLNTLDINELNTIDSQANKMNINSKRVIKREKELLDRHCDAHDDSYDDENESNP